MLVMLDGEEMIKSESFQEKKQEMVDEVRNNHQPSNPFSISSTSLSSPELVQACFQGVEVVNRVRGEMGGKGEVGYVNRLR